MKRGGAVGMLGAAGLLCWFSDGAESAGDGGGGGEACGSDVDVGAFLPGGRHS
jgi:hypothetical protein